MTQKDSLKIVQLLQVGKSPAEDAEKVDELAAHCPATGEGCTRLRPGETPNPLLLATGAGGTPDQSRRQ